MACNLEKVTDLIEIERVLNPCVPRGTVLNLVNGTDCAQTQYMHRPSDGTEENIATLGGCRGGSEEQMAAFELCPSLHRYGSVSARRGCSFHLNVWIGATSTGFKLLKSFANRDSSTRVKDVAA